MRPVLSHYQAGPLYQAWRAGASHAQTTLDLGLSVVDVVLDDDGIALPDGVHVSWQTVDDILDDENGCFAIDEAGEAHKIQTFSATTRRQVSLYPTAAAPTMLIAGFPMHRIKRSDPRRDTLAKIRAAAPIGDVLDTTMGLGYTAIEAARTARHVITVELDPAVVEVASQNPWSAALFTHPHIERREGDIRDVIETFPDAAFTSIIHDPPTFALAGELYSGAFYRELYRVLARGGRLFHYIGDLNSPSGMRVATGVIRRLGEAGFRRITRHPDAFAVTAQK
jgi:predicted methyltransferase